MFTLQRPMTSFASKRNVYQNADRWTKVKRCYACCYIVRHCNPGIPGFPNPGIPEEGETMLCYNIVDLTFFQ